MDVAAGDVAAGDVAVGDEAVGEPTQRSGPAGADLVREALDRARADGTRRRAEAAEAARTAESRGAAGRRRAARAARGTGRDSADPVRFGEAVAGLLADRGWERDAATGGVLGRWDQVVGADLASHCHPVSLTDGELTVQAESTAWATQLRLLARQLLATLDRELGSGVVTRLRVHGPVSPSWTHGSRRVRGRGPRDTYG